MSKAQVYAKVLISASSFLIGCAFTWWGLGVRQAISTGYQYAIMNALQHDMDAYYQKYESTPSSLEELLKFCESQHRSLEKAYPGSTDRLVYYRATGSKALIIGFRKHAYPVLDIFEYPEQDHARIIAKPYQVFRWFPNGSKRAS